MPASKTYGAGGAKIKSIRFGVGYPAPFDFAQRCEAFVNKVSEKAAREIAHEIFRRSQENIKKMNIPDRGILAASGYVKPSEDRKTWYVGYTAPHAAFVEYGTGPRAGHLAYRALPPYKKIYDWVYRNLAVLGTEEFVETEYKKEKKTGRPVFVEKVRFRRMKTKTGSKIYMIKPRKTPPSIALKTRRARTKEDEEVRVRLTWRIISRIFKYGTKPRPFFRDAIYETRKVAPQITRKIALEELGPKLKTLVKKQILKGIRIVFSGNLH